MLVKYFMSDDLVTVSTETTVSESIELMKRHAIHRLPVVSNDQLVGLLTEGTIQAALPSKATSLSVYEVNYLLTKTRVKDVMIKQVTTISGESLIEKAILKMRQEHIGVLPVCDDHRLVGILTTSDVFDSYLDMTGFLQKGVRMVIRVNEDHQGVLAEITNLLAKHHVNIVQVVVYRETGKPEIVFQLSDISKEEVMSVFHHSRFEIHQLIET